MKSKPGRIVECKDGKIGRTYNHLPLVNGKVQVYIIADSHENLIKGNMLSESEKRLCQPTELRIIGMAD